MNITEEEKEFLQRKQEELNLIKIVIEPLDYYNGRTENEDPFLEELYQRENIVNKKIILLKSGRGGCKSYHIENGVDYMLIIDEDKHIGYYKIFKWWYEW